VTFEKKCEAFYFGGGEKLHFVRIFPAAFTENHMKSINTPSGNMQNFRNLKQVVHLVSSDLTDTDEREQLGKCFRRTKRQSQK
jgi:hypothetical protein